MASQHVAPTGTITNALTFSSEVFDSALGLQYYNYRHLNVLDGRWVSRDPIEENGGVNVFGFVFNNPLEWFDGIGLDAVQAQIQYIEISTATVPYNKANFIIEMEIYSKGEKYCTRHKSVSLNIDIYTSVKWATHENEHAADLIEGLREMHKNVVSWEKCYCSQGVETAKDRAESAKGQIEGNGLKYLAFEILAKTVKRVDLTPIAWKGWMPYYYIVLKPGYEAQFKKLDDDSKYYKERFDTYFE